MNIVLDKQSTETDQEYTLTTDHPASSYGQPVLVDQNNNAYGSADIVTHVPKDVFGESANITAGMIVARWCTSHLQECYEVLDPKILRFAGI